MRKLMLASIVVVCGLSTVQDADAGWRRRAWRPRANYRTAYWYDDYNHSGVYYDSGLAFEYDWAYTRPVFGRRARYRW